MYPADPLRDSWDRLLFVRGQEGESDSTAGAGVSWLHVRLDDRPKYYGFKPYKKTEIHRAPMADTFDCFTTGDTDGR